MDVCWVITGFGFTQLAYYHKEGYSQLAHRPLHEVFPVQKVIILHQMRRQQSHSAVKVRITKIYF